MTGMRLTLTRGRSWNVLAALLALAACVPAYAQRQEQLLDSAEIEGRKVILPGGLHLELEWYSPVVEAGQAGRIVRGWVEGEYVLLETDRQNLICVLRKDGTEKWRLVLEKPIRYRPCVSRNNVVVNVDNFLVAIEKRTGEVRWRLLPKFVMSTAPLVVDPPAYPKEYKPEWQDLERVYVGAWDGRIHALTVRGRLAQYSTALAAPEFDLFYTWHKTHETRGIITMPLKAYEDQFYYACDDSNVYAVTRDAETRAPYKLQGAPCTNVTVDTLNLYVGAQDYYVYAIDRLTLRKKWTYACGGLTKGNIYADEPAQRRFVYVPTAKEGVHALEIRSASGGGSSALVTPESFEVAWKVPGVDGVASASEKVVYLGSAPTSEFPGYKGVTAVDKQTGKVLWKTDELKNPARFYLEFHNAWRDENRLMRIFAVTEDNRLLSFKEPKAEYGPVVEKKTEAPAAAPPK
ncbi:MAG: PQQ-binding-like beta-propeller repeat protein [Planctomycetota bacterium]|nr:PQQ-binding-like beta-propeller repeat protein [Planctomycetota bacterium]